MIGSFHNHELVMKVDTRPIKGHKLIRSRSGAQDGYAQGRCECEQWYYQGWTTKMGVVIDSHRNHLMDIREKMNQAKRDNTEDTLLY